MQNLKSGKETRLKTAKTEENELHADPPVEEPDKVDIASRVLNLVLDMSVDEHLELLKKMDRAGFQGARNHARKKISASWKVVIQEGSGTLSEGHIKDISGKGVFIRTTEAFLDGQKIFLRFKIPNHQKTLKIIGEVVRLEKNGIGVKFIGKLQKNRDIQDGGAGDSKIISIRNYL